MTIASCLVDTNILLRMTRRSDPQHQLVDAALARLASQGTTLHYTHQNIAELWNAMTRPRAGQIPNSSACPELASRSLGCAVRFTIRTRIPCSRGSALARC